MIVPLLAFPCPPPVTPQTPGAPLDAYKSVLGATEGFIIMDCFPRFPEGIAEVSGWLAAGRIRYDTDIVEGLENAPEAVNRLFDRANTGKLLVQCSEP